MAVALPCSQSHMETMCALLEEIAVRDREHAEREAQTEARAEAERQRHERRESHRDVRELIMLGLTAASMVAAVVAIFAG